MKSFIQKLSFLFGLIFILGIQQASAQTYYWVGGTGNWDDVSHWSNQSGALPGPTGPAIFYSIPPSSAADVVFDTNSFLTPTDTVYFNIGTTEINSMTWNHSANGSTFAPRFQSSSNDSITITRSLILDPLMDHSYLGQYLFNGGDNDSIVTAGQNFFNDIRITNFFDTLTLVGDLNSTGGVIHDRGGFDIANRTLNIAFFRSEKSVNRELFVNNTNFHLSGSDSALLVNPILLTKYGSNEVFHIEFTGEDPVEIGLGDDTFLWNQLLLNNPVTQFIDSCYFSSVIASTVTAETILINSKQVLRSPNLQLNGTCGKYLEIYHAGVNSGINTGKINGDGTSFTLNYCKLSGILGTGSNTATNSVNLGGNFNISFPNNFASTDYYWVGGNGNFYDPTHWSLTSGGTPDPCFPGPNDDVFFDANSGGIDTLLLLETVRVKDASFAGITSTLTLSGSADEFRIGDHLIGSSLLNSVWTGTFNVTTVADITSNGTIWQNDFALFGIVDFLDDFQSTKNITLSIGDFVSNGHNITASSITALEVSGFRNIDFSGSDITITGELFSSGGSSTNSFTAPNNLTFSNIDNDFVTFDAGKHSYNDINVNNSNVHFVTDTLYTDVLNIQVGSTVILDNSSEHFFNDIIANGTCTNPIILRSYATNGNPAVLNRIGGANTVVSNVIIDQVDAHYTGEYIALNSTLLNGSQNWIQGGSIITTTINFGGATVAAGASTNLSQTLIYSPPAEDILSSSLSFSGVQTTAGTNIDSCSFGIQSTIIPTGLIVQTVPVQNFTGSPYSYSISPGTADRTLALSLANDNTVGGNFSISDAQLVITYVAEYTPPASQTYYWHGGSGEWSDLSHWSLNSGNIPAATATCLPSHLDNVIFDNLSFSGPNDTIVVNSESYINDITWTPTVQPAAWLINKNLTSLGDVLFQPGLSISTSNKESRFTFQPYQSTTDFNPNSAFIDLPLALLAENPSGSSSPQHVLNLQNDLIMTDSSILIIGGGQFYTNDFDIRTGSILIGSYTTKKMVLGSSKINLHYGYQEDPSNGYLDLDAGTSSIIIDYTATDSIFENYFYANDATFYDVTLNFNPEVYSPLTGNNTFHDLTIGKGSKISFNAGSSQTITDSLILIGTCADSIHLISSSPADSFRLTINSGNHIAECLNVKDSYVLGSPITTLFSTDGGNNTSWVFDNTIPVTGQLDYVNSYCFGDTLQFSQNSTAFYGPPTISWSFGDGEILNNDTTQHMYSAPGTYNLQLTATSANFCKEVVDTMITILDPAVLISSNESDTSTCQGYTVDLYANAQPDTLITYQYFVNGAPVNPPTLELDTFSTTSLNDMDTVFVTVIQEGCQASSGELIFNVNPIPNPSIFSNVGTTICQGDLVKIYGNGADAYQLYKNGIPISPFSLDTVELTDINHNDTLYLIGRLDSTLCQTKTAELIFTVNSLPSASLIDDDSLSNTICQGDTVTWTASSLTGVSFSFLVNNSVVSTSASPSFPFDGLNQGDVATVVATNVLGCNSPASNSLFYTVNALPTPIITANVNAICEGEQISFTASGVSNYTFLINDSIVSGPSGANFYSSSTLINLDEVKIFGTQNECPAFSNTIVINATPLPVSTLVSNIGDTICQGELPQVTATNSIASTYEFFINGLSQGPASSSNQFNPTSPLANGSLLSVVSSLNGCDAQDQINFVVNPTPNTTIFTNYNSDTICQGDPLLITGSGGSSYSFMVNGVDQGITTGVLSTDTLMPGPNETYVIANNAFNCPKSSDTLDLFIVGLPIVNLMSDAAANTICAGTPTTFTASIGAEQYQFFLNSSSLGLPSASNTYSTSSLTDGDTITVLAYNNGCPNKGLDTIIMNIINNPPASIIGTPIYCSGAPQIYTAGTGTNYQFLLNAVTQGPPSSVNTFDASSLTPGNYALQTIVEENGCTSTSTLNITVLTTPTVAISGNNLICSGTNTIFQGTGANSYEYYVNGILSGSSNTFATSILNNGDVVSLIGQTVAGCPSMNSAQITMTVNPTPTVNLISDDADGILCQGQNVLFTASGASNYEFFVNGNSTGTPSPTNMFSSSSTTNGQTISVAGSSSGCFDTDSLPSFVVVNYPVVSLANAGDTSLCTGDLTQLSVSGANDYLFYVNGIPQGVFGPVTTFSNTVADGDIITVEGMINTCVSSANSAVQYSVFNYPITSLTSTAVNNEICLGDQVTFTGTGALDYDFFIDNVPVSSGSSSFSTSELVDGQSVILVASNGECSTTTPALNLIVNTLVLNGTVTPANYMICEGEDVLFQTSGADEYEIYVNGVSQGAQSPTNSFTLSNLNDLDLITFNGYSNSTGCTQTYHESSYIHVATPPAVTIDQNTTICEGDSTILSSNSTYGNQWILNGTPIPGANDTSFVVYNSGDYSLSVTKGGDGNLWSQGFNANGEIGNGTNFNTTIPAEAAGLNDVQSISSGLEHTTSLLASGAVYTWGSNLSGQLGNGTFTSSNSPIQLTSLPSIADLNAGGEFTLAVSNSGDLYAWGDNGNGQLGLNNTIVYNSPQLVASQSNVKEVAAGVGHSIILKSDSTVWTAGNNDFGQLGLGNLNSTTTFNQINGLNSIVSVEAGEYHSMAIDVQGNLFLWGNNGSGQLGLNDLTNRITPESSSLKKVTQVSGGNSHTMVVLENGSVYTMGSNLFGQLGTNNTQDQITPQINSQIDAVKSISAGQYFSLVLKKDGTVFGAGRNNENAINSSGNIIVDSFEIILNLDGVTELDGGRGVSHYIFGNENECSSPNVVMTVNPSPVPTLFFTNGALSTTVTNVANYQWFVNGVAILDSDTSIWTPTADGFYTVLVTYDNGCSKISKQYPIGVTSIQNLSNEINTVVYPNPTKGNTTVVWNQKGFYSSYIILDVTGRTIFSGEITPEMIELPIDLLNQGAGVYNLILEGPNGQLFKHKLIKL